MNPGKIKLERAISSDGWSFFTLGLFFSFKIFRKILKKVHCIFLSFVLVWANVVLANFVWANAV